MCPFYVFLHRSASQLHVDYCKHYVHDALTKCNSSCFHQGVFSEVVGGKRRGPQEDEEGRPKKKKSRQTGKDEEYYIPYRPKDFESERGWGMKHGTWCNIKCDKNVSSVCLNCLLCAARLSLSGEGTAFEQQASSAVLDLMGDEGDRMNQHKNLMKWWRFHFTHPYKSVSLLLFINLFPPDLALESHNLITPSLSFLGTVRGSGSWGTQERRTRRRRLEQMVARSSATRRTRRTCILPTQCHCALIYC